MTDDFVIQTDGLTKRCDDNVAVDNLFTGVETVPRRRIWPQDVVAKS